MAEAKNRNSLLLSVPLSSGTESTEEGGGDINYHLGKEKERAKGKLSVRQTKWRK